MKKTEKNKGSTRVNQPGFQKAVLVLFFLSGATGLIYEVLWAKLFSLVFGSTILSVTTTITVFLGGLAFGSYLFGRRIDSADSPLRVYAFLELGVGALAVLFLVAYEQMSPLYQALYPYLQDHPVSFSLVRFVLASFLILPPTVLMGGTLPVLCRYLVREDANLARNVGLLYSLNTFGAVAGCLVCAFFLIGLLGVNGTVLFAAAVNIVIGLLVLFFCKKKASPPEVSPKVSLKGSSPSPRRTPATGSASSLPVVCVFAASGFCSLGYEVIWTRSLIFFVGNSIYAFSIMLAAYLTGLVLGSLAVAKWEDRVASLRGFALAEIGIGVSAWVSVAIMVLLSHSPRLEHWLTLTRFPLVSSAGDQIEALFLISGLSLAVMIVPTFLIGMTFPMASRLCISNLELLGRRIGSIYSLNTLGGIAGSFATGFILIPLLGQSKTLMIMVTVNLGLGFFLLSLRKPVVNRQKLAYAAGAVLLIIGVGTGFTRDMIRESIIRTNRGKLAYFGEGVDGTVAVFENRAGLPQKEMVVNGTAAGSTFYSKRYMRLLGHLPLLLHRDPQDVLVICLGTGTTLGAAWAHRGLESLTCVELSSAVRDAARLFQKENRGVLDDPTVRLVLADGRNHLLLSSSNYDVITLEPPPPREMGVSSLYSTEFYGLCRRRLRSGGLICQWIPLLDQSEHDTKMLIKTFLRSFPHSQLWLPVNADALLVGSLSPLELKVDQLEARAKMPRVRQSLEEIGFADARQLLACLYLNEKALDSYVKDSGILRDNSAEVEYFRFLRPAMSLDTLPHLFQYRSDVMPMVSGAGREVRDCLVSKVLAMQYFHRSSALNAKGRVQEANAMLAAALRIEPDNEYFRRCLGLSEIENNEQNQALRMELKNNPENPYAWHELGKFLLRTGRTEEAVSCFEMAVSIQPDMTEALYDLAKIYNDRNRTEDAFGLLQRVIEYKPTHAAARMRLASLYHRRGEIDEAVAQLEEVIRIQFEFPQAHRNLAALYHKKGRLSLYEEHMEIARKIEGDIEALMP
ncbi:MAG: fused MFS/spermidine synthase [Pseudomonadota bacterium]